MRTSLSNWTEILANDFGYIPDAPCDALPKGPCGANSWDISGRATALLSTLELFNVARSKSVAVFFITGRKAEVRERLATEATLKNAGYDGWTMLLMRPDGFPNVMTFKTVMREKIEGLGFTIIANVGDQDSDLVGGHAERTFKVPNPFYFIP